MKKTFLAAVLLSTALAPAAASAAPIITFTEGVYTAPALPDMRTVQNFDSAPDSGAAYVAGPGETVTGDARVFSVTWPGTAVDPRNASGNHYLSIVNGSYSVALERPAAFFSFILGSLDNYNVLTFGYSDGTSQAFTGRQIIGAGSTGPFNSATSGRVSYNFSSGPSLTSATFSSGTPSFEIDDIVSTAPEPASWAMMLLGVGAAGGVLRRRRTKSLRPQLA